MTDEREEAYRTIFIDAQRTIRQDPTSTLLGKLTIPTLPVNYPMPMPMPVVATTATTAAAPNTATFAVVAAFFRQLINRSPPPTAGVVAAPPPTAGVVVAAPAAITAGTNQPPAIITNQTNHITNQPPARTAPTAITNHTTNQPVRTDPTLNQPIQHLRQATDAELAVFFPNDSPTNSPPNLPTGVTAVTEVQPHSYTRPTE